MMQLCRSSVIPISFLGNSSISWSIVRRIPIYYSINSNSRKNFSQEYTYEGSKDKSKCKVNNQERRVYKEPETLLDYVKLIPPSFKLMGREFSLFLKEVKEEFQIKSMVLEKGAIHMLFTFEDDESINKFIVSTDSGNAQGYSTASFVRTQYNTGLFSGNIVTDVPVDGQTTRSGYANILSKILYKSFKRKTTYNWTNFTHLVMKIRGDGRTYVIILNCPGEFISGKYFQYHYPLYTRGGPYWQLVKIPFSNFYFTVKGRISDQQTVMPLRDCARIGITLADGNDGPFRLEIDYVGLEFQHSHKSVCPYESYKTKTLSLADF